MFGGVQPSFSPPSRSLPVLAVARLGTLFLHHFLLLSHSLTHSLSHTPFGPFSGVLPYVGQFRALKESAAASASPSSVSSNSTPLRSRSVGFSTGVCFVLLVSNIARVFYWYCVQFETPLLVQSVVMIGTQLLLLQRCVEHPHRELPDRVVSLRDLKLRDVWRWTAFEDYVHFLTLVSMGLALVTLVLEPYFLYREALGYVALVLEAGLAVPQCVSNARRRSTVGLSTWMVIGWAAGDAFKVLYSLLRKAPLPFFVCGCLQLAVDFIIAGQIVLYSKAGDNHAPTGTGTGTGTGLGVGTGGRPDIGAGGGAAARAGTGGGGGLDAGGRRRPQPLLDVLDALAALRLPSPAEAPGAGAGVGVGVSVSVGAGPGAGAVATRRGRKSAVPPPRLSPDSSQATLRRGGGNELFDAALDDAVSDVDRSDSDDDGDRQPLLPP